MKIVWRPCAEKVGEQDQHYAEVNPLVTEFINKYKKQLTWALYAIAAVLQSVLFLADQLAGKKAARIVQTLISGVLVGGVYGLVALGIVVINKASGVFNFAHGWMMVVGGMIFWSFFTVSEISVLGAGLLATATMLMVMSTVSWRSLLERRNLLITYRAASPSLTLLMTIGGIEWQWLHALTGTIAGAISDRFGCGALYHPAADRAAAFHRRAHDAGGGGSAARGDADRLGHCRTELPVFVDPATGSRFKPIRLDAFRETLDGIAIIRVELVFAFVLAIIAFVGFILFFRYTSVGLAMRATSEDQQLAQSVGLARARDPGDYLGGGGLPGEHRRRACKEARLACRSISVLSRCAYFRQCCWAVWSRSAAP